MSGKTEPVDESMPLEAIERASDDLLRELGIAADEGNVGIGDGRLFVYIHGRWKGARPGEWQGFPVTWRVGGGRPKAQAAA